MDTPNLSTKKISEQIRAQSMIIEPKGERLKLRMIGSSLLVDMPGELDGDTIQSGVIVPEASRKKMQQIRDAIILGVGPDVTALSGLKEGDRVLIRRVQVEQVVYDGVSYFIAGPHMIIAVLPEVTA